MVFADLISSTPNDIPVVVGAIVTLVGGFFAIAKVMLSQASKDRESDRRERLHLADAINRMADNSNKMATAIDGVAAATQITAEEAKERNGHLAELVLQNTNNIVDAVTTHYDQHIKTQKVDKQIIKK